MCYVVKLEGEKTTINGGAVGISWLLQASHSQRSLNPHIGEFVSDTDQHGLMDAIKEVIINLGVLCHTAQQLVDQLTHSETHCVAIGFVRL